MPLHPFMVHFPIAAWILGSLVLVVAATMRRPCLSAAAWTMLVLGAAASIPAAVSGQAQAMALGEAANQVLERHRTWGNLLPWLMIAVVLAKAHFSFSRKGPRAPAWIWPLLVMAIAGLLLFVGLLGGELVYLWGVGVKAAETG